MKKLFLSSFVALMLSSPAHALYVCRTPDDISQEAVSRGFTLLSESDMKPGMGQAFDPASTYNDIPFEAEQVWRMNDGRIVSVLFRADVNSRLLCYLREEVTGSLYPELKEKV